MTSLARVFGTHAAVVGALLSFACQKDGNALFDNSNVNEPSAGSGGSSAAGAQASGGTGNTGADSGTGGSSSQAGEGGTGAKAGSGGEASEGGSAGSGGTGEGGSAGGGGNAGSGGTKPDPEPEPITVEITDFEDAELRNAPDDINFSCDRFENYGSLELLDIDADASGCTHQVLLRASLAEIPEGAIVSKATLTLTCTDLGGLVDVSYVAEAWVESSVSWSEGPDVGTAIGTLLCDETHGLGPITLDLKTAVVAWLAGEPENHGLYLQTETDSGTGFASSENDEESSRPVLSVTYTRPVK